MERERALSTDELDEANRALAETEPEPQSEDVLDEFTRLEGGPEAEALTPERKKRYRGLAERGIRELRRRFGHDEPGTQHDLFPHH